MSSGCTATGAGQQVQLASRQDPSADYITRTMFPTRLFPTRIGHGVRSVPKEAFYDSVLPSRQVQRIPRRNIWISQEQRIRVSGLCVGIIVGAVFRLLIMLSCAQIPQPNWRTVLSTRRYCAMLIQCVHTGTEPPGSTRWTLSTVRRWLRWIPHGTG